MTTELSPAIRAILTGRFDCVVMATWSDWHTEGRKNRYQYASRFARYLPVIFIQADLDRDTACFETTEFANLHILHVSNDPWHYDRSASINRALLQRGYRAPLLWCYSFDLLDFIAHRWAPLRVYHATEDYFDSLAFPFNEVERLRLIETVEGSDLMIAVSQGVLDSFNRNVRPRGPGLVVPNGCDFDFWHQSVAPEARSEGPITALYQGMITNKLDFDLLTQVVSALPDWQFWFCGAVVGVDEEFERLLRAGNVRWLGQLPAEELRDISWKADVGLIPFRILPWLKVSSLPLKAFEYVAAGLPVVTTPIDSLEGHPPDVFWFAETASQFVHALTAAVATRRDDQALAHRAEVARQQDYDARFAAVCEAMVGTTAPPPSLRFNSSPRNALVIYDQDCNLDLIRRLADHSRHCMRFLAWQNEAPLTLQDFQAVIVCLSSAAVCDGLVAARWHGVLEPYGGLKIALAFGEAFHAQSSANLIEALGFALAAGPADRLAVLQGLIAPTVERVPLAALADRAIEQLDDLLGVRLRVRPPHIRHAYGFDAAFSMYVKAPLGSLLHGRVLTPSQSEVRIEERYRPLDCSPPPLPAEFHIADPDRADARLCRVGLPLSALVDGVVFLTYDDAAREGRVHRQARQAAQRGHATRIVCLRSDPALAAVEERDGYTILRLPPTTSGGARLPQTPSSLLRRTAVPSGPPHAQNDNLFLAAPPEYDPHDFDRLSRLIADNLNLLEVTRELRPLAVHCHGLEPLLAGAWLKRDLGCRLIADHATPHGLVPRLTSRWAQDYLAALDQALASWPDACISDSEARLTGRAGVTCLQPDFPALPLPSPDAPAPTESCLIYHGPLVASAGLERLLQMVRHLTGVGLTLRGEGPARDVLIGYAKRLGIGSRVRFEQLPPTAVERVTAAREATLAVIPSLADRRGTVFEPARERFYEYLHGGVPVLVSSHLTELARTVEEEGVGRKAPPEDLPAMLAAARTLLRDAASMRRRALEVAARCRWETVADLHLAFYRDSAPSPSATTV